MKKCISCGFEFSDDANFCPECGANNETKIIQPVENVEYQNPVVENDNKTENKVNSELIAIIECVDKNKKRKLIKSFEIKNDKKEICDVATIAYKEIENGNNKKLWLEKLYSCAQKSKLLFPNEEECGQINMIYEEAKKIKNPISNVKMTIVNVIFSLTIIGCSIWFIVSLGLGVSDLGKIFIGVSLSIIAISIILYIIFRKMNKAIGK